MRKGMSDGGGRRWGGEEVGGSGSYISCNNTDHTVSAAWLPRKVFRLAGILRDTGTWRERVDATGNPTVPIEALIMASLKCLGRARCFDASL